jgi:hypothetical protein
MGDNKKFHGADCNSVVRYECGRLKRLGFSGEEVRSLFTCDFEFPVSSCRTLCACWCLMISRHGPSLLHHLGAACVDVMQTILQAVSLSCAQAKACAADMVIALSHHCNAHHLRMDDPLRHDLRSLLQL